MFKLSHGATISDPKIIAEAFNDYFINIGNVRAILNEALNRNKEKIDLPSEFICKNKTITDAIEIANSFNEYFANIGPNLSKKIDPSVNSTTTYKSYLTDPTDFRFQFRQISELEVRSAIEILKIKQAAAVMGYRINYLN